MSRKYSVAFVPGRKKSTNLNIFLRLVCTCWLEEVVKGDLNPDLPFISPLLALRHPPEASSCGLQITMLFFLRTSSCGILLAAILAILLPSAFAQVFPGLPSCAQGCSSNAASESGCTSSSVLFQTHDLIFSDLCSNYFTGVIFHVHAILHSTSRYSSPASSQAVARWTNHGRFRTMLMSASVRTTQISFRRSLLTINCRG